MSVIVLLFYAATFLPSILGSCFEPGLLYAGPTLHEPHSIKTTSAENCQGLCQQVFDCNYFTWYSDAMGWDEYDNDCVLFSSAEVVLVQKECTSGPKYCNDENEELTEESSDVLAKRRYFWAQPKSCCEKFDIETIGGGNFYQEERLGSFQKIGNSVDGRNVYKQQNGDNYMYYVANAGHWMIGKEIGKDLGGVLNTADGFCPEELNVLWKYWNDFRDEWVEDSNMEVSCNGDDPDPPGPGGCASGPVCDSCNNWASVDGVKYCCAQNCDYGYVSVSSSNGVVTCDCYQK